MIKGVMNGVKLRISALSAERADEEYKQEIEKLAHALAGEFEKELTEAVLEEFKPHIERNVKRHRDMMFGGVEETTTIGYDIDIAMDMRSAARCALANSLVNFKPVKEKV